MEKLDYKQSFKELYAPKNVPSLIQVPTMNFLMVNGHGNPNDEHGEYHKAVELLYAFSYSIKMTRKANSLKSQDFTDYVVPPLEGLWWLEDEHDMDFTQKSKYCWISMIRLPEFITQEEFIRAQEDVRKKRPDLEVTKVYLENYEEGLCVQCMHIGPYADEPATIAKMEDFITSNHLVYDIGTKLPTGFIKRHHEIYLSDPRKANPKTMKTILRHPVKHMS